VQAGAPLKQVPRIRQEARLGSSSGKLRQEGMLS
jgi:hypothetical protein